MTNRPFAVAVALLLFCALLLSVPAGIAEEPKANEPAKMDKDKKKELTALVDEYFNEKLTDPAEMLKLFQRIRKFDPVCKDDLKFFTEYCWRKVATLSKPDKVKGTIKVTSPFGGATQVIISGKAPGAKTGFIIGFHGGGQGSGDGSEAASNWSGMPNCLGAFPTAINLIDNAWNDPPQERFVLWLLRYIRRAGTYDTNKVYAAGHSMGGQGTYGALLQYADIFTAGTAGAGNPVAYAANVAPNQQDYYGDAQKLAANLFNTPIYFYHSADDPRVAFKPVKDWANVLAGLRKDYPDGYEHIFSEYTDNGHGLAKEGIKKCLDWMWEHTRNPRPKKVRWMTYREWKQHQYWLFCLQPKRLDLIEAEYVDKNEVKVSAKGIMGTISVLFNDKLVDTKKPVKVTCNGREVFNGMLENSVSAMICAIREYEDPEFVYTARVDIDLP